MSIKSSQVAQKQVDRITGQTFDMFSLEKSKKRAPVFDDFVQIPPSGALLLSHLPVQPRVLRVLFVCFSRVTWNNCFQMTPNEMAISAKLHRKHYPFVMNSLVQVGAILKANTDDQDYHYWLNPQLAWKGLPDYFWTVEAKFKTIVTAPSKMVCGGDQLLICCNKLNGGNF
jgi:hypothetical protein